MKTTEITKATPTQTPNRFDRRALLIATGLTAAGVGIPLVARTLRKSSKVFIARNQRYDGPLQTTIRDGLLATGVEPASLRGKHVLLKPNMVEPTRLSPQMTTHPAVVLAAAEVFRNWARKSSSAKRPATCAIRSWH